MGYVKQILRRGTFFYLSSIFTFFDIGRKFAKIHFPLMLLNCKHESKIFFNPIFHFFRDFFPSDMPHNISKLDVIR